MKGNHDNLLNIFVLVCSLSMRHAHVVFQDLHVTPSAEIETFASSYKKNPVLSVFFSDRLAEGFQAKSFSFTIPNDT